MKHFILIFSILSCAFQSFAQNYDDYPLKSEVGGKGMSPSSQTPGSFIKTSNQHTFIKDSLNWIQAVSHGYDETYLTGYNCVITQLENSLTYHVLTPNAGQCMIAINGVNSKTKRSVNLGLYTFQVADSVYHDVYLDQILSGNAITDKVTTIHCKNRDYWNGKEKMELLTWKIRYKTDEVSGTGNELSTEARKLIGNIPKGEALIVITQAKSNLQKPFTTQGVFLKN